MRNDNKELDSIVSQFMENLTGNLIFAMQQAIDRIFESDIVIE